jgi:uncharacterized protein (DUF58 family)
MSSWVRPARPLAPIGAALLILSIWWLVAHNGGSGWVQALGDLVFGTLVIGILGPAVVLAFAKVQIVDAPVDGIAGVPVELQMKASTRLRVRLANPLGREVFVGPVGRRHSGADNSISLLPAARGVHETVTLDLATAAPFALQWWTRRVILPLPSTLHVAPRRGRPQSLSRRHHEEEGETFEWKLTDVGQTRGARPYAPGDSRRQVHWGATAHAGELMVRERERPSAEPVTIKVTLPSDPNEAERVAERALGTVVQLLDRGASVVLGTVEQTGAVLGPVTDRRRAGRRLARAVAPSRDSAPTAVPGSP